jgi:hypothetical protein
MQTATVGDGATAAGGGLESLTYHPVTGVRR